MVLGDEYHRTEHVHRRATAGVTLQGGGGRGAFSRERGGARIRGPRALPPQRGCDVTAAPAGLPPPPRHRRGLEVRNPRHSGRAPRQRHGHGRPPLVDRARHPRRGRLRVPDRRLHRPHVRPDGDDRLAVAPARPLSSGRDRRRRQGGVERAGRRGVSRAARRSRAPGAAPARTATTPGGPRPARA